MRVVLRVVMGYRRVVKRGLGRGWRWGVGMVWRGERRVGYWGVWWG